MVWAMPRSLATTRGITIVLFSCRYLDVSVPCVCLPYGMICLQHTGLPHSEISASKVICTYAELIAAYHVLHRLWEPRHPPYALIFLLDCYSYIFYMSLCTFSCTPYLIDIGFLFCLLSNMSKNAVLTDGDRSKGIEPLLCSKNLFQ